MLANPSIATDELHVWQISLTPRMSQVETCLSEDELLRARKFHFENDKDRFTAARAALRTILAAYLSLAPRELVFSYSPKGKPELSPRFRDSHVQFNLSHSGGRALLAVARDARVGADIELIDTHRATAAIAERFFSPVEFATLQAVSENQKNQAFFQCWTRKEAYLKALGTGLTLPLDSFDVSFGPDASPALLRSAASADESEHWRVYDIPSGRRYVAAVVAEGHHHRLNLKKWPLSDSVSPPV
jgi:4'-phosphopantetheinyl transferase